ncbi:hypothetical protein PENSPDRAFT_341975 [Peniophora sp. CONT]|nr:hypothetical protein PENSPDRAFT_341975 [Peniophora sp. CONT]
MQPIERVSGWCGPYDYKLYVPAASAPFRFTHTPSITLAMLSLPTSAILAALCSAPLYGVNCILVGLCAYVLTRKRGFKNSNWPLAVVIGVQWIVCTGHFASLFAQLIRGFIHPPQLPSSEPALGIIHAILGNGATNTTAYFLDQSSPEHTAEVVFYIFNSLVADCFMTWRVYVVWDRRAWLAAPFITLNIVTLVFGALVVKSETQVWFELSKYFTGLGRQRVLTMWAASVATQTSGTVLIAYRELSTPVYVPSTNRHRYCTMSSAACAVIDSGAMYTISIILTLAFYTHRRAEGAVIAAVLGQIAATVPLSIILREWWKTVMPGTLRGPLIPRSALLQDNLEMEHRGALQLPAEHSRERSGVNISVVKATHGDVHSLTASDDGLKNMQLENYASL